MGKRKYQQRVQCEGPSCNLLYVGVPECYLSKSIRLPNVCAGIDTLSNVSTCNRELLVGVASIPPTEIGGAGGMIQVAETGNLPVRDSVSGEVLKLPIFAVSPSQLPDGCSFIIGLPAIRQHRLDQLLHPHAAAPQISKECARILAHGHLSNHR